MYESKVRASRVPSRCQVRLKLPHIPPQPAARRKGRHDIRICHTVLNKPDVNGATVALPDKRQSRNPVVADFDVQSNVV